MCASRPLKKIEEKKTISNEFIERRWFNGLEREAATFVAISWVARLFWAIVRVATKLAFFKRNQQQTPPSIDTSPEYCAKWFSVTKFTATQWTRIQKKIYILLKCQKQQRERETERMRARKKQPNKIYLNISIDFVLSIEAGKSFELLLLV